MNKYLTEEEIEEIDCGEIYKKNDLGGNTVFMKRILRRNPKVFTLEFYRHNNVWGIDNFNRDKAINKGINQLEIDHEILFLNKKYKQKKKDIKDRDTYVNVYSSYDDSDSLGYHKDNSPDSIRINKLIENVKPHSLIYDVGCNSGGVGRLLIEKKKCVVYGSEISNNLAKKAKSKGLIVYSGFAEEAPFESNSFDYIILSFILEHVLDPDKLLERSVDTLKRGGIFLGFVPTEFGDWGEHTLEYHPEHLRSYSKYSLKKTLEKFKLKNIRIEEEYLKGRDISDYYFFSAEK